MRLFPIINTQNSFVNSSKNVTNKSSAVNNSVNQNAPKAHKYTGVASMDLAYVSMFDSAIARDLKIMGLI